VKPNLSKLFTPWKDPQSGVVSNILTARAAPLQQVFYFVNSSFSTDNRYLWFYAAFPPAGSMASGRVLGVADLAAQETRICPETAFTTSSPLVDGKTGGVYWCNERVVCHRGPGPEDAARIVCTLPEALFGNRAVRSTATHLTMSPDGRELFLDSHAGRSFFGGTVDIETGTYTPWKEFDRYYNHAQFNPVDRDLVLLAQDHYADVVTGVVTRYEDRLWLLRRNGAFAPLFPRKTLMTHEWWDADGKHLYAVNNHEQFGGPAVVRIDIDTVTPRIVWPGETWHAKDHDHGSLFVRDRTLKGFYRGCPSCVQFRDQDGRETTIVSHNPELHTPGSVYHIDPHPHFSPDGSLIAFTTTVLGRVDVAVVPVEELRGG